jgi:hypothetical protein
METDETNFPIKIALTEGRGKETLICETPLDIPDGQVFRVIETNVEIEDEDGSGTERKEN